MKFHVNNPFGNQHDLLTLKYDDFIIMPLNIFIMLTYVMVRKTRGIKIYNC